MSPLARSAVLSLVLTGFLTTSYATENSHERKEEFPSSRRIPINEDLTVNSSSSDILTNKWTRLVIPCLYLVIFIIGLPANALGFWILFSKIKRLPSTIYLLNLAMADLLLILALPLKISYHLLGNDWPFGEVMCRVSSVVFNANIYSSILLLTCVAMDRYLAVVRPFLSKGLRRKSFSWFVCSVSWALVLLAMLPHYFTKQSYLITNLNITTCDEALPLRILNDYFNNYTMCLVGFGFILPCLITALCYVCVIRTLVRSRERYAEAIKLTLLVFLVFLMCLTPGQVMLLMHVYTGNLDIYVYVLLGQVLSTANSCIDPFIYYYASSEFRDKVKGAICARPKQSRQASGKTNQSLLQTNSSSRSCVSLEAC